MIVLKDIENRKDIEILINSFYDKVKEDKIIGYFFSEVINVDWEKHLPTMYNFWESIIFGTPVYEGNPMRPHMSLHEKSPMESRHFEQWLKLFTSTVDEHFSGEKAEFTKQRAMSIATVMQIKIIEKNK